MLLEYCVSSNNGNVGIKCPHCHNVIEFPISEERLLSWKQDTLIQNHFTELTPGQRELLISGICEECWNEMFPEEDEE